MAQMIDQTKRLDIEAKFCLNIQSLCFICAIIHMFGIQCCLVCEQFGIQLLEKEQHLRDHVAATPSQR